MPTAASTRRPLPRPDPGPRGATGWVSDHLGHLVAEPRADIAPSPRFRGGQAAADRALAAFDVTGYAAARNEAYPTARRGASGLSPYIRHGLLSLPQVWDAVAGGPDDDVSRFRDELLWQEYARHWYARLGSATVDAIRNRVTPAVDADQPGPAGTAGGGSGWDEDMACLELTVGELEDDGWLVNQTRMWLASHWTVRLGRDWAEGEDYFFRHLLDGSRAANRLGWQWVTGAGSNRSYGFSRWQVERRAPGLCASCELGPSCPIDRWPDEPDLDPLPPNPLLATDPDPIGTAGPFQVESSAGDDRRAEVVWLTAESLGHSVGPVAGDPALAANPDLPAVFVFDEPLLAGLRLSAKRLIFLAETLAELAEERELAIHLGDPAEVLAGHALATTFAPVPGWRRRAARLDVVETHPWPWLRRPGTGPIGSHGAWRRKLE